MSDFDLQAFLSDMRHEQRTDHETLVTRLDELSSRISIHETRLTVLENLHKSINWIVGTVIVGVLGWIISLFKHS